MAQRLRDTGIPVLFLVGEHDMITPADLLRMCHELLPNSRYYMAEGSGHSVYWEKPDEFNRVVSGFLKTAEIVLPPSATPAEYPHPQ